MVQARSSPARPEVAPEALWPSPLIVLGALALILGVSLVIGWLTPGYVGDLTENKSWARLLVRGGMHEAYRNNIDYAPVPLYVFAAVGWVYQALIDPTWNERAAAASGVFTFLMKLPMIAAHVAMSGVLYLLGASTSRRVGLLAMLAYGLNPATLYNIAHFGQADALVGLLAVLCLAAVVWRQGLLLGVCAAALLLSKPQGWIILPIIGLAALQCLSWKQRTLSFVGALAALTVLVSPWLITGRPHHFWRYLENLNTHALSNRVISADAHNLWWIPTLLHWDWIEDSVALLGPASFRTVATVMALVWLGACVWALLTRARGNPALVAAAASFGFFMLMVRAHENHGYLTLPLLALALAIWPRRELGGALGLASLGLLMNLMLRDPLLMDPYTSVPDPGQEAPGMVIALQVLNVGVNACALSMFAWLLRMRGPASSPAP